MSPRLPNGYTLKCRAYYLQFVPGTTPRLYLAAWREYRALLNTAIDSPTCDSDVADWLNTLVEQRVNNPRSPFYLRG